MLKKQHVYVANFLARAYDSAMVKPTLTRREREIMDEAYAVTVERDVTQHERVEQAFDDAVIAALEQRRDHHRLGIVHLRPWFP